MQLANLASQKGGPFGDSGGFNLIGVLPQKPVTLSAGIGLGKLKSLVEWQAITPSTKAFTQPFSRRRRQAVTSLQKVGNVGQEKWSIVVYLSRFAQAAIFSMLSCTPSLNTTPSMT